MNKMKLNEKVLYDILKKMKKRVDEYGSKKFI